MEEILEEEERNILHQFEAHGIWQERPACLPTVPAPRFLFSLFVSMPKCECGVIIASLVAT